MSLWKKEKKEERMELTFEEQEELLRALIKKQKEEWMSAKIQEWIYTGEAIKPTHMGKAQAESALATYQKRVRYCEENILAIELYAKNHSLSL